MRETLIWLQGPGIEAAIGFLLSFVVEWFPNWETMSARVKRLVMIGICLVIPLGSKLIELLVFGGAFNDIPGTWWLPFAAGVTAYISSQVAHLRKLK